MAIISRGSVPAAKRDVRLQRARGPRACHCDRVVVRGIGPSLAAAGVPNALANPTLELRDGNGALLSSNNDWQDNPAQAAELTAAGLAPTNQLESGIAATLPAGHYTALLSGVNNSVGVGWWKSTTSARRSETSIIAVRSRLGCALQKKAAKRVCFPA